MLKMQSDLEAKFTHRKRLGSMRDVLVRKITEKQKKVLADKEVNSKRNISFEISSLKTNKIILQEQARVVDEIPKKSRSKKNTSTSSSSSTKSSAGGVKRPQKKKESPVVVDGQTPGSSKATTENDETSKLIHHFSSIVKPDLPTFKIPRISIAHRIARDKPKNIEVCDGVATNHVVAALGIEKVEKVENEPKSEENENLSVRVDDDVRNIKISASQLEINYDASRERDRASSSSSSNCSPYRPKTLGEHRKIATPEQPATPYEIMIDHDREILVKMIVNTETGQRDWVHLSAHTKQNYIGTGAMLKMSSKIPIHYFNGRHRCEDVLNNRPAMFPVKMSVRPEFQIGRITFKPWLNEVPAESSCIFAPQRIQLGRVFIRDYVAGIDMINFKIKIHSHGCIETIPFEWRRGDDLFEQ